MRQIFLYMTTVITWLVAFWRWKQKKSQFLFYGLVLPHLLQAATIGQSTGMKYGRSRLHSCCMSFVFGFFWWLPLYRQIKAETFCDADFTRTAGDLVENELLQ